MRMLISLVFILGKTGNGNSHTAEAIYFSFMTSLFVLRTAVRYKLLNVVKVGNGSSHTADAILFSFISSMNVLRTAVRHKLLNEPDCERSIVSETSNVLEIQLMVLR